MQVTGFLEHATKFKSSGLAYNTNLKNQLADEKESSMISAVAGLAQLVEQLICNQ